MTCTLILLGPNLDLLNVWQTDTAHFCEDNAKLYFDAKQLEKGLNRGWRSFWHAFFQKNVPFLVNIGCCLNFLKEIYSEIKKACGNTKIMHIVIPPYAF